jgi:hypothetical protein
MSRTPEAIEKQKVRKYLDRIGAYSYWPVPSGYGRQGVDCYVCAPMGFFLAIEVKATEKEKPTARQMQTLEQVWKAGGLTYWGTADQIIAELKDVFRPKK